MRRLGDTPAFQETRAEFTQLVQQRNQLAREIADECSAGEWVPWGVLRQYRSAKQRLEDFAAQMEAAE